MTDGHSFVLLPEAKDYKRIGEGDTGLNTGGMGAVSPVPFADAAFMEKVSERIVQPTIDGLATESLVYEGIVFFGLIKVGDDPFVIEYNCRFGDPETEVVLPRIENDFLAMLLAISQKRVHEISLQTSSLAAVTVMAVSGGYPAEYQKGIEINGLSKLASSDSLVFHAGTTNFENKVVTNGGRVLAVTSYANDIDMAAKKSNLALNEINFDGMYFRTDIGYEFKK
jgi:phosphoribosylamine--glycine ligase